MAPNQHRTAGIRAIDHGGEVTVGDIVAVRLLALTMAARSSTYFRRAGQHAGAARGLVFLAVT